MPATLASQMVAAIKAGQPIDSFILQLSTPPLVSEPHSVWLFNDGSLLYCQDGPPAQMIEYAQVNASMIQLKV